MLSMHNSSTCFIICTMYNVILKGSFGAENVFTTRIGALKDEILIDEILMYAGILSLHTSKFHL